MAERVDLAEVDRDLGDLAIRQPWGYRAAAGERILKRTPALIAEVRVSRRLLEQLVGAEPVDDQGCIYCHEGPWPEPADPDEYPHVAECPWLQAVNEVALVRAVHTIRDIDSLEHGGLP